MRLFQKTERGKLTRKCYAKSLKGRAVRQKNRQLEKNILSARRYMQSERGRLIYRQRDRRRRERKRGLDLQLSTNDIRLIYERFDHKCFNCGTAERLEIDHHYPLSKGFGLSLENAVLLCRSCNAAKHTKLPEEFYSPDKLKLL
jgi:5-methylcytosine-specific restriction endonuclease McrA